MRIILVDSWKSRRTELAALRRVAVHAVRHDPRQRVLVRPDRRRSALRAEVALLVLDDDLELLERECGGRSRDGRMRAVEPESFARPALPGEDDAWLADADDEKDGGDQRDGGGRVHEAGDDEGRDEGVTKEARREVPSDADESAPRFLRGKLGCRRVTRSRRRLSFPRLLHLYRVPDRRACDEAARREVRRRTRSDRAD